MAFKHKPMKNIFSKNLFLLLLYILVSCSSPDTSKPVAAPVIPVTPVPPVTTLTWTNDSHLKALYAPVRMLNGVELELSEYTQIIHCIAWFRRREKVLLAWMTYRERRFSISMKPILQQTRKSRTDS